MKLEATTNVNITLRRRLVILNGLEIIFIFNIIYFYCFWVLGTFGTAILQLPVECGHEGGRVTVEYEGAKKLFESHQDSDKHFFLSAFYGNCDHSMEQITRGWKLALVFNLV
jgi:hypothetical protein